MDLLSAMSEQPDALEDERDPVLFAALLARAEGGDIDMKIVLDTNPAIFTAAFYAKRPASSTYTLVSNGALNLLAQDILGVGFARTTGTLSGRINSFDLSVIPEPASSVLLALGAITLTLTARRKW